MQLLMTWPDTGYAFLVGESRTFERAVSFIVETGKFAQDGVAEKYNVARFYCTVTGPVIFNACRDYVCLIDGSDLAYGEACPLRFDSEIQLGHFKFEVTMSDESDPHEDMVHNLLNVTTAGEKANLLIPEIEDILPNGGHYTGDLRYFNEVISAQNVESDALKKLEVEYKKFLIWGEQNRRFFDENTEGNTKLSPEDDDFGLVRESMKTQTLTECIIDSPSLIDKVWEELGLLNSYDDLLCEEEKHDILKSLAPDNISSRERKQIPELVFHDLYKTGLDSHY